MNMLLVFVELSVLPALMIVMCFSGKTQPKAVYIPAPLRERCCFAYYETIIPLYMQFVKGSHLLCTAFI